MQTVVSCHPDQMVCVQYPRRWNHNGPFARSGHVAQNYVGTEVAQWDFQSKGTRTSPARVFFVLEVPLCNLHPSIIYSVPCDRIVQRAYFLSATRYSAQYASQWKEVIRHWQKS